MDPWKKSILLVIAAGLAPGSAHASDLGSFGANILIQTLLGGTPKVDKTVQGTLTAKSGCLPPILVRDLVLRFSVPKDDGSTFSFRVTADAAGKIFSKQQIPKVNYKMEVLDNRVGKVFLAKPVTYADLDRLSVIVPCPS